MQAVRHILPLASLVAPLLAVEARSEDEGAIQFEAAYTADILSNLDGGIRRGTRYLDNLDLTLEVDGEKAFGWDGATFFVYGLYNNGTRFSETLVGDAQVVSNIETGVEAARLYEAWLDQKLWDDRLSLRAGLYDLNSEFDAIGPAALFLNSAHGIGTDFGQTGENGPSIFPVTSLALRAEVSLSDNWRVRTAVLDGVPGDPDHPKRTAIKLGDGDGALLVGEMEFTSGTVRIAGGYWRYTGRFETMATQIGQRGNDGAYAFAEAQMTPGLALYLRGGWASAAYNMFDRYVGAGAVVTAPFATRPDDQLGVAIAWARTGDVFRQLEESEAREVALELTYRAALTDFLTVQPDIQYVINPGADPALKNALVGGIRLELSWGYSGE